MDLLLQQFLKVRQTDYLVLDQHFKIQESSDKIGQFTENYEPVQLGQDVRDYFPELIGTEAIIEAILQGEQENFELNAITRQNADHSLVYFNIYFIRFSLSTEVHHQLILLFEDATQRMNLEQALVQETNESRLLLNAYSRSQNYINKIITSMEDSLIVTNQKGIIKKVNAATLSLLGYQEQDLIQQPLASIVNNDSFLKQFLNEPTLDDEEILFKNIELSCRKKNGDKIIIEFSISALRTDLDNSQDLIYVGRDVTARKRDQQRMLAQYQISRVLSEANHISEALIQILLVVCETLEWSIGEVWMPDDINGSSLILDPHHPDADSNLPESLPKLHCIERWGKPILNLEEFNEESQSITFELNGGLPGCIWGSGLADWIEDMMENDQFIRRDLAKKLGLHTAFGFPIKDGKEVLGVITFLSQDVRSADAELMQTMTAIGNQLGLFIKRKRMEIALHHQQQQTERLLLNILPEPIANRLKQEPKTIAENFAEVTVLFADIVGFTQISSSLSPIALVTLLNDLFSTFDRLTEKYELEKIKTIGDAYMVVGGLPHHRPDHAVAIANMALDMQAAILDFNQEHNKAFSLRIGIHSGPVVAGVIGIKKFLYDLWGDTVNIASRMESHGLAGRIQISEDTYKLLPNQYIVVKRGMISIKGKGAMNTYFLLGNKQENSPSILSQMLPAKHLPTKLATQRMVEILHNKLAENSDLDFFEIESGS